MLLNQHLLRRIKWNIHLVSGHLLALEIKGPETSRRSLLPVSAGRRFDPAVLPHSVPYFNHEHIVAGQSFGKKVICDQPVY